MPPHFLLLGHSPDARRRAASAQVGANGNPFIIDSGTLPLLIVNDVVLPRALRVVIVHDIERAFPDNQTGGARLVLTQSTYLMQKWIDVLEDGDQIAATANRAALQQCAPEFL